jgi:hypothetical protein
MSKPSEIIGPVLVFVGLTAILSFVSWRRTRSAWRGVVIDKVHVPGDDEGGQPQFFVVFRTDAGKRVKLSVAGQSGLDGYTVGQRVEKKPGQPWPSALA